MIASNTTSVTRLLDGLDTGGFVGAEGDVMRSVMIKVFSPVAAVWSSPAVA